VTDEELLELAREVLTPRQLRCWMLAEKKMSQRAIAYDVGVDRSTVREHLDAAARRLREAGAPT